MRLPSRWKFILPAVAFLMGWGACLFVLGKPVFVKGTSMFPTLKDGDCLLEVHCLPWSPLDRGEVVVIKDGQGLAIKRIIGLPGETISFSHGDVIVDRFALREPYLARDIRTTSCSAGKKFTLGPKQYFVMGDNRPDSYDSRYYGPVDASRIVGSVDVDQHQQVEYLFRPPAIVYAQERGTVASVK